MSEKDSSAARLSASNLVRWSGLANAAGGVLLVVSDGYELGETATTSAYRARVFTRGWLPCC
jgi:hypothetical protein